VTLVMVQCYAGSFANVLFDGGDPEGAVIDRKIAGFFAAPRERTAAGCTPELNEAEYHDFTSYFFAALTGRDRVGRVVKSADYNRDGRVGMDEAYAYTLAHDASIDVPVCTTDIFLRRFVTTANEEIFQTGYSQVRAWATPAQRAALEELSRPLKLTGDSRLAQGYRMMTAGTAPGGGPALQEARRRFMTAREEARRPLLERWPELGQRRGAGRAVVRAEAVVELERRAAEGRLDELKTAEDALKQARDQAFQASLEEARVLRFVRLAKSVVLAHRLRESGDATVREQFERLVAAEAETLLPPAARAISRSPEAPSP
jgi:hypothetical protein